jgi:hypothetical protein
MNRLTTLSCSLAICGVTSLAWGQLPLIDPPTPPPCAADGTCYPNTCRWGYYPSRWRTWPGTEMAPEPSSAGPTPADQQRVSPELGHSETPPAELEDAAAPPSSPRHEPPAAPGQEQASPDGSGDGFPQGMPNVPLPDAESPSTSPLTTPPPSPLMTPPPSPLTTPPTSGFDPPPTFPSALSMRSGRSPSAPVGQAIAPPVQKPGVSRVTSSDPPPSPPWIHSASL